MEIVAFIIGAALLIVGLAVSIALHEVGHMYPAKKFGVRVDQFMVGFGRTLWSRRKGETEYGIKAIPLGGYVSMAGMYPPSPREPAGAGRAGGGFFRTMVQDAREVNDETLGTGDEHGRYFYELPVYKRVIIMLGGPIMNFLLAVVLFAILFSGIGVQTATSTVRDLSECVPSADAVACAPGDPAAAALAAGVQPGDRIVSIDGQPVHVFDDVSAIVGERPNQTVRVVVERDGVEQTLNVPLVSRTVTDASGAEATAGFLGVFPVYDYVHAPIWAGPQMAVENTRAVMGIIWQLPVRVWDTAAATVTGQERDPDGPLSIVGASGLAGEVASADAPIRNRIAGFIGILASVNIALFVFNLVPLLPLDGGHVVVALWDGIKRKWAQLFRRPPPQPADATKLVPLTFAVFIAMLVMGGILIIADFVNPISLF